MIKKIISLCGFLVLIGVSVFAQEKDAILGKWQNPTGEGRIEIFKKGDAYFGKLYWLRDPNNDQGTPKLDVKNPDPSKKNRPVKDLEILTNFHYKGKGLWADGEIYDPKVGKTYHCKMTLKGPDQLSIRGYVGISLLGRSEIWTRVK